MRLLRIGAGFVFVVLLALLTLSSPHFIINLLLHHNHPKSKIKDGAAKLVQKDDSCRLIFAPRGTPSLTAFPDRVSLKSD